MRPKNLKTKIFLDGGDPAETREIIEILGFLDGQTTNPTLVAKNPYARQRFESGEKFSKTEIFDFYKQVVKEISGLIPDGSVSIEVYSDEHTTAETMYKQGCEMNSWITNAHVKYPITQAGLEAASKSIGNKIRVNMTLCFTQTQAGAVYSATAGAAPGDVFISPFVGRLDDQGQNGMDLIKNIVHMYEDSDHHVQVLAASVRNIDHFMESLAIGTDIITAPLQTLKDWAQAGLPLPSPDSKYDSRDLTPIEYQDFSLGLPWQNFDISDKLTSAGVKRFASDWNQLLA